MFLIFSQTGLPMGFYLTRRETGHARWAGLGAELAFCLWSTVYMSSSCLHDVFVLISRVSHILSWGLSKIKLGICE